jgi:hypothetical protein
VPGVLHDAEDVHERQKGSYAMADEDAAADTEGLDDEELAFRHSQEDRDQEQDDADNDASPGPPEEG